MKAEHERAIGSLRTALGTSDQLDRAQLLAQLNRTIYAHGNSAASAIRSRSRPTSAASTATTAREFPSERCQGARI